MKVFTLGYQGLSLDLYTETLLNAGVGIVLDVRETAWSYNRRYIKSVLQKTLLESKIDYTHLRECGNPSANRKTAKTVQECLDRYRDYLRANQQCLEVLLAYIADADASGRPACLTCYEQSPHDCHRSILLDLLSESMPTLQVFHLQKDVCLLPKTTIQPPLFWDTIVQLS